MSTVSRVDALVRRTVAFDGAIEAATRFDDLGFDSLDAVGLLIEVEDEFDIQIDMDEAESFSTFGELVSLVDRKIAA